MAYTMLKSDGTVLCTIADGTIDTTSTSLALPGRNYSGYGQPVDQDLIKLLENFAGSTAPVGNLKGQLWFDTSVTPNTLKLCPSDGAPASSWLSLLTNPVNGDLIVNGNANIALNGNIVGDLKVGGSSTFTGPVTFGSTPSTSSATGAIILPSTGGMGLGGNLNAAGNVTGSILKSTVAVGTPPLTVTSTTTVTNLSADLLDGYNSSAAATATTIALRDSSGNLYATYYYGTTANTVTFNTAGAGAASPAGFDNSANVTVSYNTVGAAVAGNTTNYYAAGLCNSANATGINPTAGTIYGAWTLTAGSTLQATYADLAERFSADDIYDAGTVVELGGDREVTAVVEELSDRVFGVVSSSAAFMMNSYAGNDATHPPIAVGGRVPVKVVGPVRKGDRLVSAGRGRARAAKTGEASAFNVIGRALVEKQTNDEGVVEAFVTIK